MHPVVEKSIQEVYAACFEFQKPAQIDSCDCCHTEGEKKILISVPLSSLSCEQLNDFVFSAFNTIGDAEDFLYFLPRILELAVTEYSEFGCDIGLLGHKLYQTRFWERGERLRASVNNLLLAHFEHQVLKDTDWNYEICDWVCCIGNATPDIEPFLELLFVSRYFRNFYEQEHQYAVKGKLGDAFWEEHHGNKSKIVKWLLSPECNARYWTFFSESGPGE